MESCSVHTYRSSDPCLSITNELQKKKIYEIGQNSGDMKMKSRKIKGLMEEQETKCNVCVSLSVS